MNDKVIATLKSQNRQGMKSPVIHILMPDGRVTEFKNRAVVIPGQGDGDDGIFAVLYNAKGEMFVTPNGQPAILTVPAMGLGVVPDPAKWLSWKEMAKRAGVSLSTAKRMSSDGVLPQPEKLGLRKVGFRQGEVDAAVAQLED